MNDTLDNTINGKLDIILTKITKMENDILEIKEELGLIKVGTTKMESHIDFIDNVYDKVETPLNYICNKFNRLIGTNDKKKLK